MSVAQSIPSNVGWGLLSSTISITSKSASTLVPSISIVIPYNLPIGRIFCWVSIHSWIGNHYNASLPMHSNLYFGKTFASNPRSRITLSISYSLIYAVNLIFLLFCIVCFLSFQTIRCSLGMVPTHLVMSSCSPFTTLLSCSIFMHVSKNAVSIDASISSSSLSLLPEVEASAKLLLASMNVSLARSKSTSSSFVGALRS